MNSNFRRAGHKPTLLAASLYVDMSYMVWVLLGPLAVQIDTDLNLTSAQEGMMVATPILSGALLRILMGVLVDHLKPRMAGIIGQIIVLCVLTLAWLNGIHSYHQVLLLGIGLGMAGAAFAVSLPLASRWYPPEHQGTALGITGGGNSGSALAALFAPGLALAYGWNNVFGLAIIPLLLALGVFIVFAKDSPECPPPKSLHQYLTVLKDKDTWWFMFFYSVTFGGCVGLAASLPLYFHDQYDLSPVNAGYFAAVCVFASSVVRTLGGNMADRIGGIRTLIVIYVIAALSLFTLSFGMKLAFVGLGVTVVAMLALGMGNGAVFQLVPQRFRKEIGVMTGLVGMAGGIGGFYLASSLGYSRQVTGSYQIGLIVFASLAVIALVGLTAVKKRWRTTWGSSAATTARV